LPLVISMLADPGLQQFGARLSLQSHKYIGVQ
jgi:hypothetical protein